MVLDASSAIGLLLNAAPVGWLAETLSTVSVTGDRRLALVSATKARIELIQGYSENAHGESVDLQGLRPR